MELIKQLEKDIEECISVLDKGDEDLIEHTARVKIAVYDKKIEFNQLAYKPSYESLKIILGTLEKYRCELLYDEKRREEENQLREQNINDYKKDILQYQEKIKSIESKLEILINKMPNNISITANMGQSQQLSLKTEINNVFSDTKEKVKSGDIDIDDKEDILQKISELEKLTQTSSSEENKEDRIKATLRWLSTKSKNTITLLMPLLEIVVKYLLTKQI